MKIQKLEFNGTEGQRIDQATLRHINFPSLVRFAIPRFRFKGAPCMQMRDETVKNENE